MAGGWGQSNLARFGNASDAIFKGASLKQKGLENLQGSLGQIAEMGFTGFQNRKQRDLAREMPGITSMTELQKKIGERAQTAREVGQDVGDPLSYLKNEPVKEKGFLEGLLPNVTGPQPVRAPGAPAPAQTVPFTAADQPAAIAALQEKYRPEAAVPVKGKEMTITPETSNYPNLVARKLTGNPSATYKDLIYYAPDGRKMTAEEFIVPWDDNDKLPPGWRVTTKDFVPGTTSTAEAPVREGEEPPTQAKEILNRWGYAASDKEAPISASEASLIPAEKKNQWGEVLAAEKYAESPAKAAERSMEERYPGMDKRSAEYEKLFMRTLHSYAPIDYRGWGENQKADDGMFKNYQEYVYPAFESFARSDLGSRYFDIDLTGGGSGAVRLKKGVTSQDAIKAMEDSIVNAALVDKSLGQRFTAGDVQSDYASVDKDQGPLRARIRRALQGVIGPDGTLNVPSSEATSGQAWNWGAFGEALLMATPVGPAREAVNSAISLAEGPPKNEAEFNAWWGRLTDVSRRGIMAGGIKDWPSYAAKKGISSTGRLPY